MGRISPEEGDIHQPKHGWQHLASGAQTLHCVHQGWRGFFKREGGGGGSSRGIGGSSRGVGAGRGEEFFKREEERGGSSSGRGGLCKGGGRGREGVLQDWWVRGGGRSSVPQREGSSKGSVPQRFRLFRFVWPDLDNHSGVGNGIRGDPRPYCCNNSTIRTLEVRA